MAKTPRPKIVTEKHLARLERENLQRRYLIIGTVAVLVIALGIILYGVLDQTVLLANRSVASVDGQSIPLKELQMRVKFYRIQLISRYQQTAQMAQIFGSDPNNSSYFQSQLQQIQTQLDDANTLGSTVVSQLVDERLVAHEAAKSGVTVSNTEVDKRMQEYFGYYPNGTPTPEVTATEGAMPTLNPTTLALVTLTPVPTEVTPGTPEAAATTTGATPTAEAPTPNVSATPRPTATPYTEQAYNTEVKKYLDDMKKYDITEADLRSIFTAQLLQNKMIDKIAADVKPVEDQVWARHILVKDEITAKNVEERLKKGEDFCKVAKEVSIDTSNKDNCGDLSWFGKGKMVAEFENAAFATAVGQTSDPVKTQFGYHIIQVLAHQERPLTADEIQTTKQTEFSTWLSKLDADGKRVTKYDTVWQGRIPTEPALSTTGG
jgi:peptidyl-prolyl cis-trans isomerase D